MKTILKVTKNNPCVKTTKLFGIYFYLVVYGIKLILVMHDYRHGKPISYLLVSTAKVVSILVSTSVAFQLLNNKDMHNLWIICAIIALGCQMLYDYFNNYRSVKSRPFRVIMLLADLLVRMIQIWFLFSHSSIYLGL